MNEPHRGYISLGSLHAFDYYKELHLHDCRGFFSALVDSIQLNSMVFIATALQSFALGAGHSVEVAHYVRSWPFPTRLARRIKRNAGNESVWRATGPTQGRCLCEMHGEGDWDERRRVAVALREKYFTRHPVSHRPVRCRPFC